MSAIDHSSPSFSFPLAIVEDDPRIRTRIAMLLGDAAEAAAYGSLEAFEESTPDGQPGVAILGPSYGDQFGLLRVERLTRNRRMVATILVVDELNTETLQQALRAGVRDVVTASDQAQLLGALGRVGATVAAAPAPPPPVGAAADAPAEGRVITVFSTKGGAGKSVIAANLALVLARRSSQPVCLVDGDLQFGDVAVMLKMSPAHTIVEAIQNINRLDVPLLQSLLVRHATGLLVLPAPTEPSFSDQVTAANLIAIIGLLKRFCGHIVIDTPAQFSEENLAFLEAADDILLIAGMDIPNIKNVKLGLQTMRLLNMSMSKLHLVLNRANSKVRLDVAEVERTLQMKAEWLIPSDIVVPQSVNKGVPFVIDNPKSGVAKTIEAMSDMFVPEPSRRRR